MNDMDAELLFNMGVSLWRQEKLTEALPIFSRILTGRPGHTNAHLYLGDILHRLGRLEDALICYDALLAASPALGAAYNNRGNTLLELCRYEEAIADYQRALQIMPRYAEAHVTIGTALQALGKVDDAIVSYRAALSVDPLCAEAHGNLAFALLLKGEYKEGWQEHEWRWRKKGFPSPLRSFGQPMWDGSWLGGRTILLHGEQGLGDTIQFIRYASLVAQRGGRVLVECQSSSLVPLVQSIEGVAGVFVMGEVLPAFDSHVPLMTLPLLFKTTLGSIPAMIPYVSADSNRVNSWRIKVGRSGACKVGIAWRGSRNHRNDRQRSLDLEMFQPLAAVSGVEFYRLQIDKDPEEATSLQLIDLTSEISDFGDTAALIANLDLVITADTSVAHLAGAMGKPVWVLLPFAPDWRWLLVREDSPWYPGMRLFRQQTSGAWQTVVESVRDCLTAFSMAGDTSISSAAAIEQAIVLHETGKFREAMAAYQALLGRYPENDEVLYLAGTLALQQGELERAESLLRRSIEKKDVSEYRNNLGLALQAVNRLPEAVKCFTRAVSLKPENVEARLNLGVVLRMENRLEEAVSCFRKVVSMQPRYAKAWQNLGVALQALGKLQEAGEAFRQAVALEPAYATARWNLALLTLLQGDYATGFRDFEVRFAKSDPVERRHSHIPLWNATMPLAGRSLLVHAEQGFGDTFQFVRYLPLMAAQGCTVLFECQSSALQLLLGEMPSVAWVGSRGDAIPAADFQVPLLDLPREMGTSMATIPAAIPYLHPPAEKLAKWRRRLAGDTSFRVGMVWWGRQKPDPQRSIPLSQLAPVWNIRGANFYSLQVGPGSEQLADLPAGVVMCDLEKELKDFAETAAAILCLDLVVTIDTAVAHLAGALGVPTFLLLPFAPDWRWGLTGEQTPWYPTMRLYRQDRPGEWGSAVARLAESLATKVLA